MSTSVQEPGDRKYRALSGLSMGGGRSLNIGFSHINAVSDTKLLPDLMAARIPARILWLSCGAKDGLTSISQRVHQHLEEQECRMYGTWMAMPTTIPSGPIICIFYLAHFQVSVI